MVEAVEDKIIRAEGDYETHEMRYKDQGRERCALNIRTGSMLSEGWYDWPSYLQHAHLTLVLPSSGRTFKSPAEIVFVPNESIAKAIGVVYEKPREIGAGLAYGREFIERHGEWYFFTATELPWEELSSAEKDEVITELPELMSFSPKFGGTGRPSPFDRSFWFAEKRGKGKAGFRFDMKKGEIRYGRV